MTPHRPSTIDPTNAAEIRAFAEWVQSERPTWPVDRIDWPATLRALCETAGGSLQNDGRIALQAGDPFLFELERVIVALPNRPR